MSTLVVKTRVGDFGVRLRDDAAPKTCETIRKLVLAGLYNGCCIYRAEVLARSSPLDLFVHR